MKKILLVCIVLLAMAGSATAAELYGFGFAFGLDNVYRSWDLLTIDYESTIAHSGLGFNADVYIGQKLGFYGGGAIGLLTGIKTRTVADEISYLNETSTDMSTLDTRLFGEALLGLGAFFPIAGSFDLSLAGGFGLTFISTSLENSDQTDNLLSLGPGLSVSFGLPVSTNVEAYAACRVIYGMILLGDYPDNYESNLSFTPAIGVKLKR